VVRPGRSTFRACARRSGRHARLPDAVSVMASTYGPRRGLNLNRPMSCRRRS